MIEEGAVVTRIGQGQVWIKSLQSGACGGCAQHRSCGTAVLSRCLPKREFSVECCQALKVGDQVRVAIDDSHLLLSSVVLYLLPLLIMFLGIGLAEAYLPESVTTARLPEMALSFLVLAFCLIHRLQRPLLLYFCCRPEIVGKL